MVMDTIDGKEKRAIYVFILRFVPLAMGTIAPCFLSHRNYESQYLAEVERQLSAIADLKVSERVQWRKERLKDCRHVSGKKAGEEPGGAGIEGSKMGR